MLDIGNSKCRIMLLKEAVSASWRSKKRDARSANETKQLKNIQYEWGSLNVADFVQKLAQEGITDAKVEPSANGVIIHLVSLYITYHTYISCIHTYLHTGIHTCIHTY